MEENVKLPKAKVGRADVVRLRSLLRHLKNENELIRFLQGIWYDGYCDRISELGRAEKDANEEFIKFRKGQEYNVVCPKCGETLRLDFKDLRVEAAKDSIEDVMDATNWGKVDVEAEL